MAPPTTQYARFPDSLVLVALSTVADPLSERIVGDAVVTLSEEETVHSVRERGTAQVMLATYTD